MLGTSLRGTEGSAGCRPMEHHGNVQHKARMLIPIARGSSGRDPAVMSRRADCIDNAPTKSFFGSVKPARIHAAQFRTRADAKAPVFETIEGYYNRASEHPSVYVIEEKRLVVSLGVV